MTTEKQNKDPSKRAAFARRARDSQFTELLHSILIRGLSIPLDRAEDLASRAEGWATVIAASWSQRRQVACSIWSNAISHEVTPQEQRRSTQSTL